MTKEYYAKGSGMYNTEQAKATRPKLQLDNEEHNLRFLKQNKTIEGSLENKRKSDNLFVLNKYFLFQNLGLLFYRTSTFKITYYSKIRFKHNFPEKCILHKVRFTCFHT